MWCLERPLLAQGGALRACGARVGGGSHLGPREAVLVYSCFRSHRHAVGDASGGERLRAPVPTWQERSVADSGRLLGPGPQVWLSCSQDVLAVEGGSHNAQARDSQKMPFKQILLG